MSKINVLSDRDQCRLDCPRGDFAYKDRGWVTRCKHGVIFMVATDYVHWGQGRNAFTRLSPFWDRRLYRRALAAIEGDSDD